MSLSLTSVLPGLLIAYCVEESGCLITLLCNCHTQTEKESFLNKLDKYMYLFKSPDKSMHLCLRPSGLGYILFFPVCPSDSPSV